VRGDESGVVESAQGWRSFVEESEGLRKVTLARDFEWGKIHNSCFSLSL
jgi:hypothetical protein